jgi:NAD(P)-dependent dehydrogenase (short-subunit alcohol dehydrogenase family)
MAKLKETAELAGINANVMSFSVDVTDPNEVGQLFEAIKQRFSRLDLLFNNAGVNTAPTALEDLTFEEWRRVVDTNLTGVFLCTQAAFKLMKAQRPQGGRIINNGSVSATSPRPRSSAYTAAKHGVTGLTKSTSLDGRAFKIACGQIDIGNAATDMATGLMSGAEQADGSVRAEPAISADQVARVVVQMADLPLEANIQFITLMATNMPFIGRG